MLFLLPLLAAIQDISAGNSPPVASEEAAVLAPINAMLGALAAEDGKAMLADVRPEGGVTVAMTRVDGSKRLIRFTWQQSVANIQPGPSTIEERVSSPLVRIDGDIAMVWMPYVFIADGQARHCGVNLFDLVRENGAWKILNQTRSHRLTGCSEQ